MKKRLSRQSPVIARTKSTLFLCFHPLIPPKTGDDLVGNVVSDTCVLFTIATPAPTLFVNAPDAGREFVNVAVFF